MRRAVRVVMDCNLGRDGAGDVPDSDQFKIILGGVIVRALDFDPDALAGFEQDAVGADFNIEFVDLIRFERFPLGMKVDGLPRPG